jgi:hypothetical protein
VRRILVSLLAVAAACKNDGSGEAQPKPGAEGKPKIAGVFPDSFKCDSILSAEAMGALVGGTAKPVDPQFRPPKGVPNPCNYEVIVDGSPQLWVYDFDCRDDYKQRADILFEQYAKQSSDNVAQYNALADAGQVKPNDAGISTASPEGAAEVNVGAKGLDHHGQGLLFIDDDAPCYVRVVGPTFDKRVAVAKAISEKLTYMNAPMKPRNVP